MAKRVGVDKWMFGTTLVLVLLGLVMVFSASAVIAQERYGYASAFVLKQAGWAALGLLVMSVLMHVDYRHFNRPRVVLPSIAVTTLLLLAVFTMHDSHHTHRWFRFGGLFSFQPAEVAKFSLVLFLAWFLQARVQRMDDWRQSILPAVIPTLVFSALILAEPDLGTGLVCLSVSVILLLLAGLRFRYIAAAGVLSTPLFYWMLFRVPWRRARIMAFLHPTADPKGAGFHILQSLIAVGTGGITGQGLMEGKQKLFYLPEPHTDFIFANLAEELGLIGTLLVVGLFLYLGYRGLRAAVLSTDPFARFLAVGITATILIQAFFNMSVVLALLPTKGIPLPFISSGGTSLFFMLASMGVLLNITREID